MLKSGALILACGLLAACGQQRAGGTGRTRPAAAPRLPRARRQRDAQTRPGRREAYIIEPADGARVTNPVRVVFGLKGLVWRRPASTATTLAIITCSSMRPCRRISALPIPNDEQHRHFGGGQTEVELTLTPGRHTLQMVLGDHLHIPHDPPIASSVVTIEVQ